MKLEGFGVRASNWKVRGLGHQDAHGGMDIRMHIRMELKKWDETLISDN